MDMDHQRDTIIEQLEKLNKKVSRQNSVGFIFMTGIIYGVGFVIGSAVIATIALGLLLPYFSDIPWVASTFARGSTIMHR
ncbi:hypothetical protein K8R03_01785 [Candidatus Kaiserbacteria bacterium]|nr:hypothetical protein [Candidatus Kaiserbacteria bacterium]